MVSICLAYKTNHYRTSATFLCPWWWMLLLMLPCTHLDAPAPLQRLTHTTWWHSDTGGPTGAWKQQTTQQIPLLLSLAIYLL